MCVLPLWGNVQCTPLVLPWAAEGVYIKDAREFVFRLFGLALAVLMACRNVKRRASADGGLGCYLLTYPAEDVGAPTRTGSSWDYCRSRTGRPYDWPSRLEVGPTLGGGPVGLRWQVALDGRRGQLCGAGPRLMYHSKRGASGAPRARYPPYNVTTATVGHRPQASLAVAVPALGSGTIAAARKTNAKVETLLPKRTHMQATGVRSVTRNLYP